MERQRGLALPELITVVALGSLILAATVTYSIPWLAKQRMRSAVQDVRGLMQLSRIEAASRNRDCRFVVDSATGRLEVWDGLDTATRSDDELLHNRDIPDSVSFITRIISRHFAYPPLGE